MKKSYLMMALAIILVLFSNWRSAENDNLIKSTFIKNNLKTRLEDKVSEKLKIVWQPLWEKGSYDNTQAWIPLQPVMKNQQNKAVDAQFDMPKTTRYLFVEKQNDRMEFSIRTVIGENHERGTLKNFTGTILTRSLMQATGKALLYKNGSLTKRSAEWICVYWTVCNWVSGGAVGCPQYVTTTSIRSGIPNAFPCAYPGGSGDCNFTMYESHVEQYCE